MQLFLFDQRKRFLQHLSTWKGKQAMPYDRAQLQEKETVFPIGATIPIDALDSRILFDYRIFPEHILSALTQWQAEDRAIQVGDTIVQQAYLPPWKHLSVKVLFGVRIREIIDGPERIGFSYETLEGHVERGISTFTIELREGAPVFVIHTFSEPGNRLTRSVGAVFTVPYQRFCTRAAGKHVTEQLERMHRPKN